MNDGGRIWQDIDQAYRGNPPGEVLAHGWLTDAEVLRLLLTDPCPNRKCDGGRVRFKNPVNPDVDLAMDCSECGGRGWTAKPELHELLANVLHDHGRMLNSPPTERWQDCPGADAHGGTATRILEALSMLEEGGNETH